MKQLISGSRWVYKGPGGGFGLKHTVTSIEREQNKNIVVTTSSEPVEDGGGLSWLGPIKEFIEQFAPA